MFKIVLVDFNGNEAVIKDCLCSSGEILNRSLKLFRQHLKSYSLSALNPAVF